MASIPPACWSPCQSMCPCTRHAPHHVPRLGHREQIATTASPCGCRIPSTHSPASTLPNRSLRAATASQSRQRDFEILSRAQLRIAAATGIQARHPSARVEHP
eukprot:scaffold7754_cov118-Isochrysis_galbana.AAC.2